MDLNAKNKTIDLDESDISDITEALKNEANRWGAAGDTFMYNKYMKLATSLSTNIWLFRTLTLQSKMNKDVKPLVSIRKIPVS